MTRGHYILSCPYCNHTARYWVSMKEGVDGTDCDNCHKWFNFVIELKTVRREDIRGKKSPAWNAAIKLVSWVPEGITPSTAAKLLYGVDEKYTKDDDGAPFISEAYLYNLLGKEDARTFLVLLGNVLEAAGISLWEVQTAAR